MRTPIGSRMPWSATPDDAATLEVTSVGPELEFDDERLVAVSGAEFEVTVDERRVPPDTCVRGGPRIAAERSGGGCAALAPTWRSPAASTCRRCSGAARPISPARWAASTGGRCGRRSAASRAGAQVRPTPAGVSDGEAARVSRRRVVGHGVLPGSATRMVRVLAGAATRCSRTMRWRAAVGAVHDRPRFGPDGFPAGGHRAQPCARRRHDLRRDADGRAAGAGVGPARSC